VGLIVHVLNVLHTILLRTCDDFSLIIPDRHNDENILQRRYFAVIPGGPSTHLPMLKNLFSSCGLV
jgi:hypothetical protein